jgi:hypothetical protein
MGKNWKVFQVLFILICQIINVIYNSLQTLLFSIWHQHSNNNKMLYYSDVYNRIDGIMVSVVDLGFKPQSVLTNDYKTGWSIFGV